MKRERYPRIIKRYGDRRDHSDFSAGKIIFPVITIALMVTIFLFSAQPADDSQELSDGLLYQLIRLFEGVLPESVLVFLETYIRKIAHFIIYMLLGIFMGSSFFIWMVPESEYDMRITPDPQNAQWGTDASRKAWFFSWITCILYAVSDEVHQRFVPGRSGQVGDVILDTCGITVGLIILLTGIVIKKQKMYRRAMKKLG